MKLSVIIVNYNVKLLLEQCLYAVRAAAEGLDLEIYVVDNHSTDGSTEYLRPLFPEVYFIENEDNPGFAKANNQAIRLCRGEYILLLNPDTVIGENSLQALCRFLDEHPEAGAIGVKMLNAHGAFLPESKRSFPTPWVSFCKLFGLSRLFPHSPRFAAYSLPYLDPDRQHPVDVLAGAFMLIRHKALMETGLFDESFFMYGEDIDLSYRITQAGYRNFYVPERILHYKGESTKKGDRKYLHAFYDAMLIFYRKYYPQSGLLISGLIRLSIALRKGYAALFEKKFKSVKQQISHDKWLIICRKSHFENIKNAVSVQVSVANSFTLWNMDEKSEREAMSHFIDIEKFTDIIFCYPDMPFEKMLLIMDKTADKSATYHIYHISNGLIISPNY
ncbi:MAG: glycosyltransferase family 2 protein [Tannerella sp.]|jgi:GT2 family glycosyltransferase|nr:glycosyltransferase family 2 protein [Tannerella sp.]